MPTSLSAGALFPGTFDPITRGHEDLIRRAAALFGRVVVAVAASPKKAPLLSFDERIELARDVLGGIARVEVVGYAGLTVDVAREHDLNAIVRGVRTGGDYEFESQLAAMNRHLDDGIDTVLLPAAAEWAFVSATLVREVAALGGDVTPFVHPLVADRLGVADRR